VTNIAPGWYKDPAEPTTQRYWDGEGWIGAPLPIEATPPEGPPAPEPPPLAPQAGQAGIGANGATPGVHGWPPPAPFPPGAGFPGAGEPPSPAPDAPAPGAHTTPPGPHSAPPPGAAQRGVGPGARTAPPPGWPAGTYAHHLPLPEPRPHGLRLASPAARLVARLVDIAAVLALNIVVNGWFVYQYVREVAPYYRELYRRLQEGRPDFENLPQVGGQAGNLQIVIILLAAALWFAYEVPAVANTGQTPGKRLVGIKVVRLESEDRLGFGRSLRRWNTLGLPTLFWICGIGILLQIIDCFVLTVDRPLRQALHDKSAHTVVVHVGHDGPRETPTE
jgi:uncharacterized RDD family membrane protein YckC